MNVIIDGIEYVPASDAITNYDQIARGLFSFCMGEGTNEEIQRWLNSDSIYVYVNDNYEGTPITEVLADIAKRVQPKE